MPYGQATAPWWANYMQPQQQAGTAAPPTQAWNNPLAWWHQMQAAYAQPQQQPQDPNQQPPQQPRKPNQRTPGQQMQQYGMQLLSPQMPGQQQSMPYGLAPTLWANPNQGY